MRKVFLFMGVGLLLSLVPGFAGSWQAVVTGGRLVLYSESDETWRQWPLRPGLIPLVGTDRDGTSAWTSAPEAWPRLPKPPGMFRPLRLMAGPAGHVYVQDAVQNRLCLYDTAGQWLSCRAFPEPLGDRRSDRVEGVARRDGRFVFIDRDAGRASIWREAREGGGKAPWQALGTVQVAIGLEACIEQPWFHDVVCLRQGKPIGYDAFMNPKPWLSCRGRDSTWRADPDSLGTGWRFTLPVGESRWLFDAVRGLRPMTP